MVMSDLDSESSFRSPQQKSSAQSKREQKRRPKPKDGTLLFCGVCGDRALGYNFDAVSCESCKAFFRRNALKRKPFTCSFEGNCKLDPHTRKFCSGCRLKKCFTVGMKKDWILNDEQLVKRRQRQQNRHLHQGPSSSTADIQPCSSTSNDLLCDESSMTYVPREYGTASLSHHQQLLPNSTCLGDSSDYMPLTPATCHYDSQSSSSSPLKQHYSVSYGGSISPTSTTSPPAHMPHNVPVPASVHQAGHMGSGVPAKLPKQEYCSEDEDTYFSHVSSSAMGTPMPPHAHDPVGSSRQLSPCVVKAEISENSEAYMIPLNPHIRDSLQELTKIYDDIFEAAYSHDQIPKLAEKPKTAGQLFNMTDVFIRRLIRFAKHIPEFKSLSQTDQIHLLKGGIMEMFVLRSAMGFDSTNNTWKFRFVQSKDPNATKIDGRLDSSVINTLSTSMFMQHIHFVRQLQEVANKDRTILMLLFIIELMSPDRANIIESQKVSQSQDRHSMWLKAYLESIYTVAEAKVIHPKLLLKLLDVRNLGKESGQMASHLDISNLEPLLVEVFDLNK